MRERSTTTTTITNAARGRRATLATATLARFGRIGNKRPNVTAKCAFASALFEAPERRSVRRVPAEEAPTLSEKMLPFVSSFLGHLGGRPFFFFFFSIYHGSRYHMMETGKANPRHTKLGTHTHHHRRHEREPKTDKRGPPSPLATRKIDEMWRDDNEPERPGHNSFLILSLRIHRCDP
jgi:hypothetical protein